MTLDENLKRFRCDRLDQSGLFNRYPTRCLTMLRPLAKLPVSAIIHQFERT